MNINFMGFTIAVNPEDIPDKSFKEALEIGLKHVLLRGLSHIPSKDRTAKRVEALMRENLKELRF